MDLIADSQKIINRVVEKTDRAILFYSCGKDSIVLLDLIAPHFKEIFCVFMYFVKDLDHINRYINYSQNHYPNATFHQVPHWNLTWILKEGVYCRPTPSVRTMTVKDIDENVRIKTGVNYSFYGMKKSDSLHRRLMLNSYEDGISSTNKAYPLQNWKNADVLSYIKMRHLPEPIKYGEKRSNGMGFDVGVFLFLREHYPADLEKIYQAFPDARQILYEHDNKKQEIRISKTTTSEKEHN